MNHFYTILASFIAAIVVSAVMIVPAVIAISGFIVVFGTYDILTTGTTSDMQSYLISVCVCLISVLFYKKVSDYFFGGTK